MWKFPRVIRMQPQKSLRLQITFACKWNHSLLCICEQIILLNVFAYIRKRGFNVKVTIARLFRHFNWIVLVHSLGF